MSANGWLGITADMGTVTIRDPDVVCWSRLAVDVDVARTITLADVVYGGMH